MLNLEDENGLDYIATQHPAYKYGRYDAVKPHSYLYCGTVPAANAPGCTAAVGLLYKPWSLVVPTSTARCLYQRPPVMKGGTTWARNGR